LIYKNQGGVTVKKWFLVIVVLLFGFSLCYAEDEILPERTVFHLLNDTSIEAAKDDLKSKNIGYTYNLGSAKFRDLVFFHLVTPYSALRYAYYQEKRSFITPNEVVIKDIYNMKDYVFIGVQKYFGILTWVAPKNLVIRKNETIYKKCEAKSLTLINWGMPDIATYSFPIGLFDGNDLEIIAINQNDEQIIFKLKGSKMKDLQ
jgi:hypothetical protein